MVTLEGIAHKVCSVFSTLDAL